MGPLRGPMVYRFHVCPLNNLLGDRTGIYINLKKGSVQLLVIYLTKRRS